MGLCLSSEDALPLSYPRSKPPSKEIRVTTLGVDNSGKTSLVYRFKLGIAPNTIPTIGFNVEALSEYPPELPPEFSLEDIVRAAKKGHGGYLSRTINLWDAGGIAKIRPLWTHYIANIHAILYLVDSSDRNRLAEAKTAFHDDLFNNPRIPVKDKPKVILILANKQDVPGDHISIEEIKEALELEKTLAEGSGCVCWHVMPVSAGDNYPSETRYAQLIKEFKDKRKAEGKSDVEISFEVEKFATAFRSLKSWGNGMQEAIMWLLDAIDNPTAKMAELRCAAKKPTDVVVVDPDASSISVANGDGVATKTEEGATSEANQI